MSLEIENATLDLDQETSRDTLSPVSGCGDPEELFELGNRHAYGQGYPVNIRKALDLWQGAARQGHAEALASLGRCYLSGGGVAQDTGRALDLWRRAAAQGSSAAMYDLGIAYLKGEGVARSTPQAIKWLLLAVTCDHPESTVTLRQIRADATADDHEEGLRLMQEWLENPAARLS